MATEIEIEEHLEWDKPQISLSKGEFEIEINKDEIEIVHYWDHGYGGRGIERTFIPTHIIKSLIDKINSQPLNPYKTWKNLQNYR